jgi:hypothetical protein
MNESCPVCCDIYTPVKRVKISCSVCSEGACRGCQEKYILSKMTDPHCMHCKKVFNYDFIDTYLTKSFRMNQLKKHRREVLLNREKSKLPYMQVFLEAKRQYDFEKREWWRLYQQRTELICRRILLNRLIKDLEKEEISNTDTGKLKLERIYKELEELKKRITILSETITQHDVAAQIHHDIFNGKTNQRREFVMKCPGDDCRGFLSQAWKCGVCEKSYCSDCHQEKICHRDETHVCKEEEKATAHLIKKHTKPCPKCGARITKLDGCSQMWCVVCKECTFCWNTGKILTGVTIHNPHYYEYMRTSGRILERENGDIPCGGIPSYNTLYNWIRNLRFHPYDPNTNKLYNIHRCLQDIQWVVLPLYPLRRLENDTRDLDIAFMLGNISEDAWAKKLESIEINFERKKETGMILQMFHHISIDLIRALLNGEAKKEHLDKYLIEMEDLRIFTNDALYKKACKMNVVLPLITAEWNRTTMAREKGKILDCEHSARMQEVRAERRKKT